MKNNIMKGVMLLCLLLVQTTTWAAKGDNIALGKAATQSSTYGGGWEANKANNGNLTDLSLTGGELNSWWQVDLGSLLPVDNVRVYHRVDSPSQGHNIYILASPNPIPNKLADALADPNVIKAAHVGTYTTSTLASLNNAKVRYVKVQHDDLNYMGLAEVRVIEGFEPNVVGGTAFNDTNANGSMDAGELGVAGVTVTAFAADGSNAGSGVTDSAGRYSLTGLAIDASYRIEFAWAGNTLQSGIAGGTSVQFVKAGDIVNLPAYYPENYCEANPLVGVPNWYYFDPALGGDGSGKGGLSVFDWNFSTSSPVKLVANDEDIGATWGVVYQKSTKTIFTSAFTREYVGYGPLGRGGIYAINMQDKNNPQVSSFVDLQTLGVDAGGTSPRPSSVLADVGKNSLGDMDISADGKTLYIMNLYQRELVLLDIASKTVTKKIPIPDPGCKAGAAAAPQDRRPWAIEVYNSQVYVGVICSAETSQNWGNLHSYVMRMNGESFENYFDFGPMDLVSGIPWMPWPDGGANTQIISDMEFDERGSLNLTLLNLQGYRRGSILQGDMIRFPIKDGVLQKTSTWNYPTRYYGTSGHELSHLGGMALHPLQDQLLSAFLPGNGGDSAVKYDIVTGQKVDNPSTPGAPMALNISQGFGKGSGLGDFELLCDDSPPTEIGNRVWQDTDGDGIQDADESGIAGVEVKLLAADGTTVLGTATTAADGTYYFSNASGTSTASTIYNIAALLPTTAYTVQFPTTVTVGGTVYRLTTASAGSNRLIDSNAAASGAAAISTTDIPVEGANNHSFDVGYTNATPACTINATSVTSTCINSGTPSNPADDRYVYRITATGTGVGSTYNISGGDTVSDVSYGTAYSSTHTFPIYGAHINLTLTDATNTSCTLTDVAVPVPPPCSTATTTSDIAVTKVADKSNVKSGDTLRYTITAKNNGPSAAPGVELTDALPTGVTYQTHNASKGTYDSATGIWIVGAMAIGETATLTIDVKAE